MCIGYSYNGISIFLAGMGHYKYQRSASRKLVVRATNREQADRFEIPSQPNVIEGQLWSSPTIQLSCPSISYFLTRSLSTTSLDLFSYGY
uniref:Uncharacterized protein n=1 Tax=Octopus bimaculoides TaxID=37653 RepID=A0A0L8HHT0_OCTBM